MGLLDRLRKAGKDLGLGGRSEEGAPEAPEKEPAEEEAPEPPPEAPGWDRGGP